MSSARIPLDVEVRIGPRAFDELVRMLGELGYDARPTGNQVEGPGSGGGDSGAEMTLRARGSITPEAANVLLEAISNWIRQRPAPKGRFRRRKPRPVTVTIMGPADEVLSRGTIDRG
jgi:hypothetical protein